LRFFGKNIGSKHIEIACGTGTLLEWVLRWRRLKHLPDVNIVGVDYSAPMLAGAERRFAKNRWVQFQHADAASLPFPNESFHSANMANSVHCLPAVDAALHEVFRVLRPGGTMAANVLTPPGGARLLRCIAGRINEWAIQKGLLYTTYKPQEIRDRLLAVGYEIIEESQCGNAWNVVVRKPSPRTR